MHYFSIMNHYLLFVCLSVRGGTLKWVHACALILLLCSSCRLLITSNMKTTQVRLETLCITAGMPWINPCGDIQISALSGFTTWSTLCLLIMSWKTVLGGGELEEGQMSVPSPVFAPSLISIIFNEASVHVSLVVWCMKQSLIGWARAMVCLTIDMTR